MNLSKFRFTLDLHSIQSQASIPVMVGDTSVTLIISITDGGLPYHIKDGCLAKISIKRPTGTHLEEFCVVKNNAVVEYAFSQNENTCAVPGVHICDIILYGADGGVVGTPKFTMVVSERVIRFDDIVLTDEDFTAVEAMIKQEGTRQEQERLRVIAEESRAAAEEERFAACEDAVKASAKARADAERAEKAAEHASEIANNFDIGAYVEQDPTVPAWAKKPNPPTASEIGAAPAGYGLGTTSPKEITGISALDSATNNGWYYATGIGSTLGGVYVNHALVFVSGKDAYHVKQTIFPVDSNTIIFRSKDASVWGAYECLNPPMSLGVEYRTTERWGSKAVYVKTVYCGFAPAATRKEVEHGCVNVDIVIDHGGYMGDHALPFEEASGLKCYIADINRSAIALQTSYDWSKTHDITIWMKYTKSVD